MLRTFLKFCLIVSFSCLAAGCNASEERVIHDIVERNGLAYAPNEDVPYTGKYVIYWEGTFKKHREADYKDGRPHGLATSWYKNGQQQMKMPITDGFPNGVGFGWYENGQKKFEQPFKKGAMHGVFIGWYEDGHKQFEKHYVEGDLKTSTEWVGENREPVTKKHKSIARGVTFGTIE